MREWLINGFRYDLWANRQWLPFASAALERVDAPLWPETMPTDPQARLEEIFAHLFRAQRVWLSRLGPKVQEKGTSWLTELNAAWVGVLSERDPAEIVHYRNTKGIPGARRVGEIAQHVVNHGTYHRGQMSVLASAMGFEGPETDLFLWQLETNPI